MAKDYSDNQVLLDCLRQRDMQAFGYLYRQSRNRLYVLALSILHDPDASKDLLQDFFFDFWHNRIADRVDTTLSAYLYNAVRNRALNYLNKEQTISRLRESVSRPGEAATIYPMENGELKKAIDHAINHLPMMAARVFRMQYQENLSQVEIAQKLGISRHTVSSHIDRALKELRQTLKRNL